MVNFLETRNKSIDKIQSILQSKETKNMSKRTIGGMGELTMIIKDNINSLKRKANSNKKCFNYHKLGHFERDCPYLDKKYQLSNPNLYSSKNNQSQYRDGVNKLNPLKNKSWSCFQVYQVIENKKNNSEREPFPPSQAETAFIVKKLKRTTNLT